MSFTPGMNCGIRVMSTATSKTASIGACSDRRADVLHLRSSRPASRRLRPRDSLLPSPAAVERRTARGGPRRPPLGVGTRSIPPWRAKRRRVGRRPRASLREDEQEQVSAPTNRPSATAREVERRLLVRETGRATMRTSAATIGTARRSVAAISPTAASARWRPGPPAPRASGRRAGAGRARGREPRGCTASHRAWPANVVAADDDRYEACDDHPERDPHDAADVGDLVRIARAAAADVMRAPNPTKTPGDLRQRQEQLDVLHVRHLPRAAMGSARSRRSGVGRASGASRSAARMRRTGSDRQSRTDPLPARGHSAPRRRARRSPGRR